MIKSMHQRYENWLTIREASIMPGAIIPNSEFSGYRDPNKIIKIRVFVRDLGHKPRVRLLGVVQVGMGLSPRAYDAAHGSKLEALKRRFSLHINVSTTSTVLTKLIKTYMKLSQHRAVTSFNN